MSKYYEQSARLFEILEEMQELVSEAEKLVRGTPEEDRARVYWLAQFKMALNNEHGYLGAGGCTLRESVDALESCDDDSDADAD